MPGQALEAGPDVATVLWAAQQTIRMHRETASTDRATGRCKQCTKQGACPQLAWAVRVLSYLGDNRATLDGRPRGDRTERLTSSGATGGEAVQS